MALCRLYLRPGPVVKECPVVEGIIFDMDGLLIDSEPLWQEAEIKIFKEINIRLSVEDCRQTMGLRLDEVVKFWFGRKPWDISKIPLFEIERKIIENVKDLISRKGVLLPGVNYILEFFKNRKMPVSLASSSSRLLIETVIEKFDLSLFQVIRSGEDEESGKPDPSIFLSTAEQMHISPLNCLVFEDSYNGVKAAKSAGMKCVLVPNRDTSPLARNIADMQLSSLQMFSDALLNELNCDQ